jgi:oxygen-independent coproporphyrinogen-3 oxidase
MAPETVAEILSAARAAWPAANDLEVTLEANPTSVEAGRFRGFRDAGVNRVSMGLQALNDTDLRLLGRLHSAAEGRKALDIARQVFPRISFDLIYARQHQSPEAWRAELTEALALAADHLSLYQLTIEPGTAFGDRHARGRLPGLVDDDTAAGMYDMTQEMCAAVGLPAYEVSNHASDLAQSRHNLVYWRGGDYVGIGPGAHGRLTLNGQRTATETELSPTGWLKAVEARGSGETLREIIEPDAQAEEYAMMALRLSEGLDRARYAAMRGHDFDPDVLNRLESLGMIEVTPGRVTATLQGRRILNTVLAELLVD